MITRCPPASRSDGIGEHHSRLQTKSQRSAETKKKRVVKASLIDHTYVDYSQHRISDETNLNSKSHVFPRTLHAILSNPDYQHIIRWQPHGRSWRVLNKPLLADVVCAGHFKHTSFESFTRQVNGWGFKRLFKTGPDFRSYYHQCFLRGLPSLTSMMKRLESPGKRLQNKFAEPDLYGISLAHPLPENSAGAYPAVNTQNDQSSGERESSDSSTSTVANSRPTALKPDSSLKAEFPSGAVTGIIECSDYECRDPSLSSISRSMRDSLSGMSSPLLESTVRHNESTETSALVSSYQQQSYQEAQYSGIPGSYAWPLTRSSYNRPFQDEQQFFKAADEFPASSLPYVPSHSFYPIGQFSHPHQNMVDYIPNRQYYQPPSEYDPPSHVYYNNHNIINPRCECCGETMAAESHQPTQDSKDSRIYHHAPQEQYYDHDNNYHDGSVVVNDVSYPFFEQNHTHPSLGRPNGQFDFGQQEGQEEDRTTVAMPNPTGAYDSQTCHHYRNQYNENQHNFFRNVQYQGVDNPPSPPRTNTRPRNQASPTHGPRARLGSPLNEDDIRILRDIDWSISHDDYSKTDE